MENKYLDIVKAFKKARVGIIGDIMLDTFTYGKIERISPEAPVPIVLINDEKRMLGGAGNVALNICSLGGQAYLFGRIADDYEGRQILELCKKANIESIGIIVDGINPPTIEKRRVIVANNHTLRIDREIISDIDNNHEMAILAKLESVIPTLDAIIIADYAKGTITEAGATQIVALAKKYSVKILIDTKPNRQKWFKGVTLHKPNRDEVIKMTGADNVLEAGTMLAKETNSPTLVTEGANGMTLFGDGEPFHLPVTETKVLDVSGAGDTVISTVTLALAAGTNLRDAVTIANYAAGIAVSKPGTATADYQELLEKFSSAKTTIEANKILTLDELKLALTPIRSDVRLVAVSGSFDLFHAGHLSYLKEASAQCDRLIVFLNSDKSINLYKGPNRPIIPEHDRAELIAALTFVDYVIIFDELNPLSLIAELKPEVFCNGADWGEGALEKSVVESYGGVFKIISAHTRNIISSSALIKKIQTETKNQETKVIFLDRDGVLIIDKNYLYKPEEVEILPSTISGLQKLRRAGFKFFVVTNQSGIGRGMFTVEDMNKVHSKIGQILSEYNLIIEHFYYCPHSPGDDCLCRKPQTKLLEMAAKDYDLALSQTWLIGDKASDVEAGRRANTKTIRIKNNDLPENLNTLTTPNKTVKNFLEATDVILNNKNKNQTITDYICELQNQTELKNL